MQMYYFILLSSIEHNNNTRNAGQKTWPRFDHNLQQSATNELTIIPTYHQSSSSRPRRKNLATFLEPFSSDLTSYAHQQKKCGPEIDSDPHLTDMT